MSSLASFTALDFETATCYRNSICQVGLVRVEKGKITKQISVMVRPPGNYYWKTFTAIHGLTPEITAHAPTFDRVWPVIEPYISHQDVVAHNAVFDRGCMLATLDHYSIPAPEFQLHCTYRIFGKGLAAICEDYEIPLDHHNALSDAYACAQLFLIHLGKKSQQKVVSVSK